MNFPLFMQASIKRVPFGNCFHSPSTCTLTIATGVAVSLMLEFVKKPVVGFEKRQSIDSASLGTSKRRDQRAELILGIGEKTRGFIREGQFED